MAIQNLETALLWLNKKNKKKFDNKLKRAKDYTTALRGAQDLRTPVLIDENNIVVHPVEQVTKFDWTKPETNEISGEERL